MFVVIWTLLCYLLMCDLLPCALFECSLLLSYWFRAVFIVFVLFVGVAIFCV